jgi:hypothetical protein
MKPSGITFEDRTNFQNIYIESVNCFITERDIGDGS